MQTISFSPSLMQTISLSLSLSLSHANRNNLFQLNDKNNEEMRQSSQKQQKSFFPNFRI
jgi:hypothetical protein